MIRSIVFALTICLVLAGCFAFTGYKGVTGEKIGPGHCRQVGIAEIKLLRVSSGEPNATVTIQITNLYERGVSAFAWLMIIDSEGQDTSYNVNNWEDANRTGGVKPNETAAMTWQVPELPPGPWKSFDITYSYTKDSRQHPTSLECSLSGDNAPWAFEAKP